MITISFNIDRGELCVTQELDKYWYNLENSTITQCILDFLNKSGIEKSEYDRVSKINESNSTLLKENEELKKLLETSLDLSNRTNEYNKQLRSLLLCTWNKK